VKRFEPQHPSPGDDQVETLLRSFFRDELPDELPPLRYRAPHRARTASEPARLRLGGFALALAAAAAVVVFVSWALWSSSHAIAPDRPLAGNQPAPVIEADKPVVETVRSDGSPVAPLEYSIVEAIDPLERFVYETDQGPVEQRAEMRWTTLTVYEPGSGDRTVWTVPELTIEVVAAE
jgi:hypothetical protein